MPFSTVPGLMWPGQRDQRGHAIGAFPVGVLLAAEGRHARVRPGVHVRAVVGRIHDDGVVRHAEIVERLEHRADVLVVVHHRVVIGTLPAAGLPDALGLGVRAEVHVGEVHPKEDGLAGRVLTLEEVRRTVGEVVVAGLHPLLRQRAGVLDGLLADFAEARINRRVVLVGCLAVQHTARSIVREEIREVLGTRVIRQFGFFGGVQVVERAVELVEPVDGRQMFIAVAEVILAELGGGVALGLEQRGDGHVAGLKTLRGAGHTDFRIARSQTALTGNERGAPGRAALLGVGVGEPHAFVGDAVDVGRLVAHQAIRVGADIGLTDVVAPDDHDVRFLRCHILYPSVERGARPPREEPGRPTASVQTH